MLPVKKYQCETRRRSFLKGAALLGLSAATSALLPARSAEAVLFGAKEYKVSSTRLAMGTYVNMTAIHPSRDQAQEAFALAFDEIDRLTSLLSRFEADSPVARLNSSGLLRHAPQEVLELVARSLYYHKQSNGAFDITVKPLIDLYRQSFADGHKPSEEQIDTVLGRVGADQLRFQDGHIAFTQASMGITLDGIAKGFIVDRAAEILSRHGITNHLINAGGDIRTSGAAAKGKPWTIAVQDPAKKKAYPDIVTLTSGAIATSGNYEVYYDNEKMFHHIIDSRSGHSPAHSSSVTVKAPTVMDADALSTSVFVMPPAAGMALIAAQPGCACFVIDANGATQQSPTWQSS